MKRLFEMVLPVLLAAVFALLGGGCVPEEMLLRVDPEASPWRFLM